MASTANNYLTVLGVGVENEPSICLTTKQDRILFNCPEGTQRMMTENKIKISNRLSTILFTRGSWENMAGMTDVIFKATEEGQKQLRLVGPRMKDYTLSTSYFLGARPEMQLELFDLPEGAEVPPEASEIFTADKCKITPIPIKAAEQASDRAENGEEEGGPPKKKAKNDHDGDMLVSCSSELGTSVISRLSLSYSPYHRAKKVNTRRAKEVAQRSKRTSYSYSVIMPNLPGKFDAKAAEALGVPKGPLRKNLVDGESVTLPDGKVIEAHQCVGPSTPGGAVLILDCPSPEHVLALRSRPELNPFRQGSESLGQVCVVHISPPEVIRTAEYQDFTKSLISGTNASHIVLNDVTKLQRPLYVASERYLKFLNRLDSDTFPMSAAPYNTLPSYGKNKEGIIQTEAHPHLSCAVRGWPLQRVVLPPHKKPGLSNQIPETAFFHYYCEYCNGCICEKDHSGDVEGAREATEPTKSNQSWAPDLVRVSFLGTGASSPFKYRTVSGILVQIKGPKPCGVLLDAGDGTYGALVRKHGKDGANTILEDLRLLYVSHKHSDHISGMAQILIKRQAALEHSAQTLENQEGDEIEGAGYRYNCGVCGASFTYQSSLDLHHKACHPRAPPMKLKVKTSATEQRRPVTKPILVVGPFWLKAWLRELEGLEDLSYFFIDCAELTNPTNPLCDRIRKEVGADLRSVLVEHSFPSYGAVLNVENFKLVYSGDTRPCQELVRVGKGASLLIHEATHADDMRDKAISDRHCTVAEAVDVATRMEAEYTILTHFSSRFEKLVPDLTVYGEKAKSMACAVDSMEVESDRLHLLPAISSRMCEELTKEYGDAVEAD